MIVTFGVRSCKSRGVLIESIDFGKGDTHFFKYQNQPIDGHCMQMQNIIRSANVKRARKIKIDITEFIHEYFNPAHGTVWFRGIKLDSTNKQIEKTMIKKLNIEMGAQKRVQTLIANKGVKEAAKRDSVVQKAQLVEEVFQKERARRILALTLEQDASMGHV